MSKSKFPAFDGFGSTGDTGKPIPRMQGKVAPPNARARPEHPTLGGPTYIRWMAARGDATDKEITDEAYKQFGDDFALWEAFLRLYQDDANHAAQRYRKAYKAVWKQVEARRVRVARACKKFTKKVLEIQLATKVSAASEIVQLEQINKEIALMQYQAMRAHSEVGVPWGQFYTLQLPVNLAKPTVPAPSTKSSDASAVEDLESVPKETEAVPASTSNATRNRDAVSGRLAFYFVLKMTLGAILGLSLGQDIGLLVKEQYLDFESMSLPWMAVSMAGGIGLLLLASAGLETLFKNAAASMMEDAHAAAESSSPALGYSYSVVTWRTLRHACLPTAVILFFFAVEAAIIRNAMVQSALIVDSDNIAYWLVGIPFILPSAVFAAATGWCDGKAEYRKREREQKETETIQRVEQDRAESHAALTEKVLENAAAQKAYAIDHYIGKLQAQRQEILTEIVSLSEPYLNLLALYQAELNLPTTITCEEQKILVQAEEEAVAANWVFRRIHLAVAGRIQPISGGLLEAIYAILNETRYEMRVVIAPVVDTPAPIAPPSFWQRLWRGIVRFFRWILGLNRPAQEATKTP